jgi:hypothetical protein
MKETFEKFRKPLIFVGIFIAVFAIYILFIKKDPEADLAVVKPGDSVTVQDNKELLAQLQALNAIVLNTEIFSSPIFKSLQDNTIIIENRKPEGRKNPFLPLGVDDGNFVADQNIVNATTNTNGLLNQAGQNPNIANPELSKNVQNIKASTSTAASPQIPAPKIATTTKVTN